MFYVTTITTNKLGYIISGVVMQMFSGLITIVMRSMVSKCVAKDELAKAFSFVSIGKKIQAFQSFPPLIKCYMLTNLLVALF
jgi:hypothetical protein